MQKLKEIIISTGMSTRPESYSGRGATVSDLNSETLEKIFQGIQKQFGEKAAKNYVKMVKNIKVISATTFLNELYSLCSCGWVYRAHKTDKLGIAIQKNSKGNYELDSPNPMASMASFMFGSGRDETQSIKYWFLQSHGVVPKGRIECDPDGYYRQY